MNKAAINICVRFLWDHKFLCLLGKYLEVRLRDQMVSKLWKNSPDSFSNNCLLSWLVLAIESFFIIFSYRCVVASHCGLIFLLSNDRSCWAPFHVLVIHISFLIVQSLAIKFVCFIIFECWEFFFFLYILYILDLGLFKCFQVFSFSGFSVT